MKADALAFLLRLVTGVVANWKGCAPVPTPRIYFANHTSNLDAPVLWASLPPALRALTRPVAARDYWMGDPIRRYLAEEVFRAVLIERRKPTAENNPMEDMLKALGDRHSLILFPEGSRFSGPDPMPFKSGLHHLARRRPDLELVPVLLENLNRILPKGDFIAVPLMASVTFGTPIRLEPEETKAAFLERARAAVMQLRHR